MAFDLTGWARVYIWGYDNEEALDIYARGEERIMIKRCTGELLFEY